MKPRGSRAGPGTGSSSSATSSPLHHVSTSGGASRPPRLQPHVTSQPQVYLIQNPSATAFPGNSMPPTRGFSLPEGGVPMMGPGGHGAMMMQPFFVPSQFYPQQSMMPYPFLAQYPPWMAGPPPVMPILSSCSAIVGPPSSRRSPRWRTSSFANSGLWIVSAEAGA